jgi:predicted  nucleic acid-binding Zn-ribbon protein
MASASSGFVDAGIEGDRIAELQERLERSERRREAAEEWAAFLEAELESRNAELEAKERRLNDVIAQYERQMQAAERDDEPSGPFERLFGWLR